MTDANGRYRHANHAALALLGYSLPQLRRLRVADLLVGRERAADQEWARFIRERSWTGDQVRLRRSDGEEVSVQVHASVVQGAAGTPPVYVAWLRA
ncbi:MAG: PAS domain S-box protein [Candidatus Limnocylindria bacterium]